MNPALLAPVSVAKSSVPAPISRPRPAAKRKLAFRLLGIIALVGVAAFGAVRLLGHRDAGAEVPVAPPPPKVTVAAVEERSITETIELTGRVEAIESVEVRPRVSGHIQEVRFQAGQLVQPGDVLFVIDSRWYQAQADLAAAEVTRTRAMSGVSDREAQRADELLAARTISKEDAESRKLRGVVAKAAVRSAEATLATAQLDLDYTVVRSPIAGRVSRALVTSGNLISGAPTNATLLTTIVSAGDAYVYVDIDEASALAFNRLVRAGTIAGPDGRIPLDLQLTDESDFPRRGWLESSDNRLDPATGSLVLRAVFPNNDGQLLPGLFARVRVPITAPHPALLISEQAIGTDQSQKFVFTVAADGKAQQRPVKLGAALAGGQRIIRDGLRVGEQVVVKGLQRVRPGAPVSLEGAPEAPAGVAAR